MGDAEADALLAPLARFDAVVVAVSGGPDSVALANLAQRWWARQPHPGRPQLAFVTVDHGLRANAGDEAAAVAVMARRLGVPHTILVWTGDKPATGIAMAARDARYALMAEHLDQTYPNMKRALVTAHHRDDQAETVVMRLARGSGVTGLAGMAGTRRLRPGSETQLVRPLLSCSKARLVATADANNWVYVTDPSNTNMKTERAKVRATMESLDGLGVSATALVRTANRLRAADEALGFAETHAARSLEATTQPGVFVRFTAARFTALPALMQHRVLAGLLDSFGGATPAPDLSEVETLCQRMTTADQGRHTLGGAVVAWGQQTARTDRAIEICREVGRIVATDVIVQSGQKLRWDNRFIVSHHGHPEMTLAIQPLGKIRFETLRPCFAVSPDMQVRAAYAVPAFVLGDTVVAVPNLPLSEFGDGQLQPVAGLSVTSEPIAAPLGLA